MAAEAVSPRIAVFGSVNMDLVAYVDAAPRCGETVTGREFRTVPGGKGANQAVAAARAGGGAVFIGAVGDDAFAGALRGGLKEAGCEVSRLRTVPGPSGIAHIVVDASGDNSIVVVPGANGTLTSVDDDDTRAVALSAALLLQLETPMEGVVAAARAAREAGVATVLTPAPARELPDDLLAAVDLLVPNQHEAAAITGEDNPERALEALLQRVPEVVITLGGDGAIMGRRGETSIRVPAPKVTAVDTTAAGDTFCGALAVARSEGQEPESALRFATAAAALAVQRYGASGSMPTRAEIDAALQLP